MLLALDVGNTNVTLALFDGERLVADWRGSSYRERTADELAVELRQLFDLRCFDFGVVDGVVISSVVPNINPALLEASRRYLNCEPVMVGPGVKTGGRIRYKNPKGVGGDRNANALVSHTAMLRRVEAVAPDSVIGRNTVASIQSGLMWGFVAQVEGMVERMIGELGGKARVVATGGQAALIAELTHVIEATDPLLTLEGLRLIYAQNSDGGAR